MGVATTGVMFILTTKGRRHGTRHLTRGGPDVFPKLYGSSTAAFPL
jgi:hypothetical protein